MIINVKIITFILKLIILQSIRNFVHSSTETDWVKSNLLNLNTQTPKINDYLKFSILSHPFLNSLQLQQMLNTSEKRKKSGVV